MGTIVPPRSFYNPPQHKPRPEMNHRKLFTCILLTAVFVLPALPPLAEATASPQTGVMHAASLEYYNAARTILYASLAISGVNVAFAYHFYSRNPQGKET